MKLYEKFSKKKNRALVLIPAALPAMILYVIRFILADTIISSLMLYGIFAANMLLLVALIFISVMDYERHKAEDC